VSHSNDCVQYRKTTEMALLAVREQVSAVSTQLTVGLDAAIKARDVQHEQNAKSLRWQRGLLITILLGLLAFAGEQLWTKVYSL
jgi:hypothetical protein